MCSRGSGISHPYPRKNGTRVGNAIARGAARKPCASAPHAQSSGDGSVQEDPFFDRRRTR